MELGLSVLADRAAPLGRYGGFWGKGDAGNTPFPAKGRAALALAGVLPVLAPLVVDVLPVRGTHRAFLTGAPALLNGGRAAPNAGRSERFPGRAAERMGLSPVLDEPEEVFLRGM